MTAALADASNDVLSPFATVDVVYEWDDARPFLTELEAFGSAYQSAGYFKAWVHAFDARPVVVLARDAAGRSVAALTLHLIKRGPFTIARIAGDGWANYHQGLFRNPASWRPQHIKALLRTAGRTAGIDLFAFMHGPLVWKGDANPLLTLAGVPSPSGAFATHLDSSHQKWLDGRFSAATQKKFRKKLRKLEAVGPVRHERAGDARKSRAMLDAMIAQRAQQARTRNEPDPLADPRASELLKNLIEEDDTNLEMHALMAGERIVAVLGALAHGRRLSGLVISHDGDALVAASTPGVQLFIEVARDARTRGFDTIDLGVGEARYKREVCEIEEPLRDLAFGVSFQGKVATLVYLALRFAMGVVKRNPSLHASARRLREALRPRR